MSKAWNTCLWVVQSLLCLLFLFAAVAKLKMAPATLSAATGLPGTFMRFVSVCELLGGLGLVLPGWLGRSRSLTPLAAAGLIVIMIGAVVTTWRTGPALMALLPLVTGLLLIWVLVARRAWLPVSPRP